MSIEHDRRWTVPRHSVWTLSFSSHAPVNINFAIFSNAVNINFAPVNINFCHRQRRPTPSTSPSSRLQQRRPPCVISTGHCFQIFRTAGPRPSPFFESRRRGHCFQIFAETGRRRFDFFFTTTSSRFCSPVWVGYVTFGLSTHPPRRSACRDSFKNSLFLYLHVPVFCEIA